MTIALFLIACLLSVWSAMAWHRFKILHLAPFALSFLVMAIANWTDGAPFDWATALFFGAVLYVVGWLGSKQPIIGDKYKPRRN